MGFENNTNMPCVLKQRAKTCSKNVFIIITVWIVPLCQFVSLINHVPYIDPTIDQQTSIIGQIGKHVKKELAYH